MIEKERERKNNRRRKIIAKEKKGIIDIIACSVMTLIENIIYGGNYKVKVQEKCCSE